MFRRYYDRFNSQEPLAKFLVVSIIVLVIALLLPRVPGVGMGVDCTALSQPIGDGNSQSVLATRADGSSLRVSVQADKPVIGPNENLVLNVRLYNASPNLGPIVIFLVPIETVLRYSGSENGLIFSVRDLNGAALGERANVRPLIQTRQTYASDELRVLPPRGVCNIRYEFQPQRLRQTGINQGNYRLQAVYRNQVRGVLSPVGAQTATPVFENQGVWVGEARSDELVITVNSQ